MIREEKCKNPFQLKQLLHIPLGWEESPEAHHGLLLFMSLLLEIYSNVAFDSSHIYIYISNITV